MDEAWLGPGLLALRWWALLQVQVIWQRTVGPWWTAVAGGVAILLALADPAASVATPMEDPWLAALTEVGLGGLVGLVVALPGHALVGGATASARVLGTNPGPWRALTLSLVAATALALDLHRPLLIAGQDLWSAWPLGEPQAWMSSAHELPVARLAHGLTLLALTLATPALLAAAVAELSVRLWGRGPVALMPAATTLAPWLRVAAALIATGASWAAHDAVWARRALLGDGLVGP